MQIGEQIWLLIIRAADADTAASAADRPVTSSPWSHAEDRNSFIPNDLGAELCLHRMRSSRWRHHLNGVTKNPDITTAV